MNAHQTPSRKKLQLLIILLTVALSLASSMLVRQWAHAANANVVDKESK